MNNLPIKRDIRDEKEKLPSIIKKVKKEESKYEEAKTELKTYRLVGKIDNKLVKKSITAKSQEEAEQIFKNLINK